MQRSDAHIGLYNWVPGEREVKHVMLHIAAWNYFLMTTINDTDALYMVMNHKSVVGSGGSLTNSNSFRVRAPLMMFG